MKLRNYLILLLLLFINVCNSFSQNVPSFSKMVLTMNIGNITRKMDTTPKEIMKRIMDKGSSSISITDYLAFERIMGSIDFYSDMYVIFYKSDSKYAKLQSTVLMSYNDLNTLKKALYSLLSQYEKQVYSSGNIEYIVLLKEYIIITLGNGIFSITSCDYDSDFTYIDGILNNSSYLTDRGFTELQNKTSDIKLWLDLSLVYESEYLEDQINIDVVRKYFQNSSATFSLNLDDENAICDFDLYLPNINLSRISKKMDYRLMRYIDGSLSFFTMALDIDGLKKTIKTYFPESEFESDFMYDYGNGYKIDFYEIFDGNVVVSFLENDNYVIAASLKDQDKLWDIFKSTPYSSLRKIGYDSYIIEIDEAYICVHDNVCSMFTKSLSLDYIENVINGNNSLEGNNLKVFLNNDFTFYLDIDNAYRLVTNRYDQYNEYEEFDFIIKELKYSSGSLKISSNKIDSSVRINFKNGTKDGLINILNSFMDEF
ncbi:hypothetical secreted protein [Brachyspira suanatina]|uniref:Hypothetical secreted protein n=1 Tax=Brachyspira suanatina TaxID=381802 RepID=A0A0G4K3B0_9SPIR|nr:hypothetical protein [Brachyspira suanatina]CRF31437.1 hypothetical secreted protein [Brachyspira suanatina]